MRQGDIAKAVEHIGPIHLGGPEERLRNALHRRQQDQRRERKRLPGGCKTGNAERKCGVFKPDYITVDPSQLLEQSVDQAIALVEEIAPHHPAHHRGHRPGQQDQDPDPVAPDKLFVEHQRQAKRQQRGHGHVEPGKIERARHGLDHTPLCDQPGIVGQPDKFPLRRDGQLDLVQAHVERIDDGQRQKNQHQQQSGHQQQQPKSALVHAMKTLPETVCWLCRSHRNLWRDVYAGRRVLTKGWFLQAGWVQTALVCPRPAQSRSGSHGPVGVDGLLRICLNPLAGFLGGAFPLEQPVHVVVEHGADVEIEG